MGRYDEVFRRSLEEPEGFWARPRRLRWRKKWDRVLDKATIRQPALVQRRRAEHLRERARRHVESGRGDQLALVWDSAVAKETMKSPTANCCATRWRGSREACAAWASGRATASSSTCRWCREAIVAMLACARLGAVHSVVFGGFAAHELAARIDHAQAEGGRLRLLRPRAGPQSSPTSRWWTRPSRSPGTSREKVIVLQRPQARRGAGAGPRPGLGRGDRGRRAGRLRAGRRDRSALHPLHQRHHRAAQGHRPRQRRPRGRAQVQHGRRSSTPSQASRTGPRATSAGWWATPTSSTRRS